MPFLFFLSNVAGCLAQASSNLNHSIASDLKTLRSEDCRADCLFFFRCCVFILALCRMGFDFWGITYKAWLSTLDLCRHLLGWDGLVFVMVVLKFFFFFFFKILILCLYIYIYIYFFLVSGNILNKSLFMLVGIAKNLLLFDETTIILFI